MVLAKKKPEKDLPEDCPTLRPRLRAKAIPKKKGSATEEKEETFFRHPRMEMVRILCD